VAKKRKMTDNPSERCETILDAMYAAIDWYSSKSDNNSVDSKRRDVLPKDASKTLAESKSDKSAQMILFRFSKDR
jgi:hypothetical protein